MRIEGFWFPVEVKLRITRAELDQMIDCSKAHYDYKCAAASRLGGFLYGWRNRLDGDVVVAKNKGEEAPDSIEVFADWHTIDTLCKILEMEHLMDVFHKVLLDKVCANAEVKLYNECCDVLKRMREESERVNNADGGE